MDAQKCEALITTLELGSMTAAAEQLGYSQSGITRMIGALEEVVGFPLVIRNKKGIRLTENGSAMLPLFRQIVRSENDARQKSADILGSCAGYLTIGSYYSISAMWMPGILKEFLRLYPGVKVKVREGGNRDMAHWLSEKSVDMCFCAEQSREICEWTPLFEDEISVWLPKDHPKCAAASFPLPEIDREPFIHIQPGEDTEIDRILSQNGLHPEVCFTTRDAYSAWHLVAAGLGISFNQKLISKGWNADVVTLPFDPPQYVSLGMAVPVDSRLSPAASRFAELAKSKIQNCEV